MKTTYWIFVLCLIYCVASAQENLQVTEKEKIFSKGTKNCFSIDIPQVKIKYVASAWKKYQREKNKGNYDEVKGEYILSKTIVPEISADSIIIYSILTSYPTDVNLSAFVTADDEVFFSTSLNSSISTRINTFIRNFAVNEYRNAVNDELIAEQKKLARIEEEISNLENENEKMEKKIKSNERENDRLDTDIKASLKEQEVNADAIHHQQKIIATFLEDSDLKSEQEKKLKDMEKTKKKLQKQNESLHEDFDDNVAGNKTLRKKIEENETEIIPQKKKEKDTQRLVIANVEVKLKGIQ